MKMHRKESIVTDTKNYDIYVARLGKEVYVYRIVKNATACVNLLSDAATKGRRAFFLCASTLKDVGSIEEAETPVADLDEGTIHLTGDQ